MRGFCEAALDKTNGSEKGSVKFLKMVKALEVKDEMVEKEQSKLSSMSRFVQAMKSGHSIQITAPELVTIKIERVLEQIQMET